MGKTLLAAIVAAILASLLTNVVLDSMGRENDARLARREEDFRGAVERAERTAAIVEERLHRMEQRLGGGADRPRTARAAGADAPALPAPGAEGERPLAPDGTPYVSRSELDEALSAVRTSGGAPQDAPEPVPAERLTFGEVAYEMGLTPGEEAAMREIVLDAEQELVTCLFGDRPLDEVKRDVRDSKEDPDRQVELLQGMIQNGLRNAGRLMTLEQRTKVRAEKVLGKERAREFLDRPRKPLIDPELEQILEEGLGGLGD